VEETCQLDSPGSTTAYSTAYSVCFHHFHLSRLTPDLLATDIHSNHAFYPVAAERQPAPNKTKHGIFGTARQCVIMEDMFKAATVGDLATLKACIEQKSCDVNTVHRGTTPICCAAANGHLEDCRFLIESGAKLKLPEAPQISPLYSALGYDRLAVVTLLFPYCDPWWEFQVVERAISKGYYDIADFLLGSGQFMFNRDKTTSPNIVGASKPDFATAQNWRQFILDRPDRLVALDPLYVEYALVTGMMEHGKAWDMIEFILKTIKVNINCRVKIDDDWETPLAAAAEEGNLEAIRFLLKQPEIDTTLCGKYGWPPFLCLLNNPLCLNSKWIIRFVGSVGRAA
jgi:hypothetical protein